MARIDGTQHGQGAFATRNGNRRAVNSPISLLCVQISVGSMLSFRTLLNRPRCTNILMMPYGLSVSFSILLASSSKCLANAFANFFVSFTSPDATLRWYSFVQPGDVTLYVERPSPNLTMLITGLTILSMSTSLLGVNVHSLYYTPNKKAIAHCSSHPLTLLVHQCPRL